MFLHNQDKGKSCMIGEKALYKDNKTIRSIRDVKDGKYLLWGMYEYADPKDITFLKDYPNCLELMEWSWTPNSKK